MPGEITYIVQGVNSVGGIIVWRVLFMKVNLNATAYNFLVGSNFIAIV